MLTDTSADPAAAASRLIAEFGTLPAVMAAPRAQLLTTLEGDARGVAALMQFRAIMRHSLRTEVRDGALLDNWQALLDYLRVEMAFLPREQLRVLHMNVRQRLLRDEVMSEGTVDQAAVYIREIIRRALEIGSSALILVHNHPSGDPSPSHSDIEITRAIANAAKPLGIALQDHLIIGVSGHFSLRAHGLA